MRCYNLGKLFLARSKNKFFQITQNIAIVFCAVLLMLSHVTYAQEQPDSKGRDFWLMFNSNFDSSGNIDLFITGDIATSGSVEIPGLGFSALFTVTPGVVTTVDLPISVMVNGLDTISNLGIHVMATEEVTVYGLNQRDSSTDAYLGLPSDILGTEYINLGFANTNVLNATQLGVVATQDTTTVTITPSVTTGSRAIGVPYNIVLNQGQTYQLRNTNAAPADLSGTIIVSDKPIGVFGGHQCANIPNGNTVACDHIVEMLPPVSTWGTSFVTFPLATRLNGDTFRVMAAQDATSVSINGVVVATVARGAIYQTLLTDPSVITSDKPVLVAQYSNGTSFDNVTSDPFEVIVPPFEQFLAAYTVSTPATDFSINYVGVVVPNAAVGTVALDGILIPSGDYTAIPGSGFSGVAVSVTLGSHSLSGPIPFGLTSYGFDDADSYGYIGGLALAEISNLTNLSISPLTAVNPINTEHCVVATTLDQNSLPLQGIRVDFAVSGVTTTSGFVFTDVSGESEFCYTGTVVGADSIVASVGNLSATANKQWVDNTPQPLMCDANLDSQVDSLDIQLIGTYRNVPVTPGIAALDIDGNGFVNANDARKCVLVCTNARCAI